MEIRVHAKKNHAGLPCVGPREGLKKNCLYSEEYDLNTPIQRFGVLMAMSPK